jgi:hypothetical protein
MFRDFPACAFVPEAGLSPAASPQDPIVEHAANLPRQRHAVKPKFLGFYDLQKPLDPECFSLPSYGGGQNAEQADQ